MSLWSQPEVDVTLYEINYFESNSWCSELSINQRLESEIEKHVHMKAGNCNDQGYTVMDGQQEKKIPIIGDVKLTNYSQPKPTTNGPKEATLFRIEHGECGQAKINSEYEKYVEKFAGL